MIHEKGAFRELGYKRAKKRSRKCSLNTCHRWPKPKLQRHDNKWTSLQPRLRQWQSPFSQTSSAGTLVREEWGIWGRLLQQCLSNNGMTWAWLISKPGQKPFSTSKFTDSCRSNLLSIRTHRTGWVNKDSCIKFEFAHTHRRECGHASVWGRAIVYVGQRLNKGGKCVWLALVISLNTQTELWYVLVKLMLPHFFPFVWGKKTHTFVDRNTHTNHHCHTFHGEI